MKIQILIGIQGRKVEKQMVDGLRSHSIKALLSIKSASSDVRIVQTQIIKTVSVTGNVFKILLTLINLCMVKFENHNDRYLSAILYNDNGNTLDTKRTTGWIGEPFNVDAKNEIEFEFVSKQLTKKIKLHFEDDSYNSFGQIAELYIYTEDYYRKGKREMVLVIL